MDYKDWSSKLEKVVIGSGFRVNGSRLRVTNGLGFKVNG
jgi:hypothetical protein